MKTFRKNPLFYLALAVMAGIVLEGFFSFDALPYLLLGLGIILFLAAKKAFRLSLNMDRLGSISLLLLAALLGVCLSFWQKDKLSYELESLNCHEVVVAGVVEKTVKTSAFGRSTELRLFGYADSCKNWQSLEGKIQLYFKPEDSTAVRRYDSLQLRVYLTNIQTTSESYASYLLSQGLQYRAYARHTLVTGHAQSAEAAFWGLQQRLALRMEALFERPQQAAMAKAILLGDKGSLSAELKEAFAISGLSHILAISGLHIGIIFLLLNILLRPLNLLPHGQQMKNLLILALLLGYMLLAGASPAVVRATLMFGAVLLYKLWRQRYHFLNLLGFSALFQMVLDPDIIQSIGFQLSYMAVLGIVLGFPVFEKYFNTPWKWVNYAYAWIGISLAATLFTAPWVIYYFGQFPTYFILSNVLVSILAFVLVFLGFLTVLCAYIPYLSGWLAWLTEQALACLEGIAHGVAQLPGARLSSLSIDEPGIWYLVIELAVTALVLLLPKLLLIKRRSSHEMIQFES